MGVLLGSVIFPLLQALTLMKCGKLMMSVLNLLWCATTQKKPEPKTKKTRKLSYKKLAADGVVDSISKIRRLIHLYRSRRAYHIKS